MDIEFDTDKDAANIAKHGVSLRIGPLVIENAVTDAEDPRFVEPSRLALGLVNGRLSAYTMRGETYRIISVQGQSQGAAQMARMKISR